MKVENLIALATAAMVLACESPEQRCTHAREAAHEAWTHYVDELGPLDEAEVNRALAAGDTYEARQAVAQADRSCRDQGLEGVALIACRMQRGPAPPAVRFSPAAEARRVRDAALTQTVGFREAFDAYTAAVEAHREFTIALDAPSHDLAVRTAQDVIDVCVGAPPPPASQPERY
ncbi:MAG: hypothetical protein U0234_32975 [Sandaracinus sp.]